MNWAEACKELDKCVYSDGEITTTGEHKFDKDGFCIFCGKTVEQTKYNTKIRGYHAHLMPYFNDFNLHTMKTKPYKLKLGDTVVARYC